MLTEMISQNAGAKIPRAAQTPFRVVVAQSIVVAFVSPNLLKNPHTGELSWLLLLLEEKLFSRRISARDHVHSPAKETGRARRIAAPCRRPRH